MSRSRSVAAAMLSGWAALLLGGASLVDPTRPPASLSMAPVAGEREEGGAEPPASPRVTSILISPERRVAVVDGAKVAIGDRVGAARVVDISLTAVHLRGPGGAFELPLYATPVVKSAAGER